MTALLYALNQGHRWGWLSPRALAFLSGSAALMALFVVIERRASYPMLDLGLFGSRVFTASTASAVLNYMAVAGTVFLLPFYLIQGRGFSSVHAGLLLSSQSLVMAVVTPLSGALSDRIGSRIPATAGMAILAAGVFFLSRLHAQRPVIHLVGALAVIGFGTGAFVAPNNNSLMGAAPRDRQGIAGGVLAAARNVGMVLGVGLAGAVFSTALSGHSNKASAATLTHAVSLSLLAAMGAAALGCLTSLIR